MAVVIYGIRNCDTLKKCLRWLDARHIDYRFHDYRKDGLTREQLVDFVARLGWEALLNKRGTTYRALPESTKASMNKQSAIDLMLAQPAMIKRPLLELAGQLHLGFSESQYLSLFEPNKE